MCQGVVILHQLDGACKYCQDPLAYFCFPSLGYAVPIRPGDAIIFDPKYPWAASPCDSSKTTVSVGMYLKTHSRPKQ
jgi:hypothetical protein